jgi:hypothetical protein
MPDKVALGIFLVVMIALLVCGCILTRKPRKGRDAKEPPREADEHCGE